MNKRMFETTNHQAIPGLKTTVRRHNDQTMRTRNFTARNEMFETRSNQESTREKSQRGEESETLLSVESFWTEFERRLLQFQP